MAYRIEGRDIVIDGWEKGIAESPYAGIADMRNINISGVPGEASVNFKMVNNQESYAYPTTGTLTLNATTDVFTSSNAMAQYNGRAITVSDAGAGLGGLSASTTYYLRDITSQSSGKLALSFGGAAVDLTGNVTVNYTAVPMGVPMYGCVELRNTGASIDAKYYFIDSNGRAWGTLSSYTSPWIFLGNTTLTNASGNGIVAWKGNLFVFRGNKIDVWNTVTADTSTWTYGWQTLLTSATWSGSHMAYLAKNDDTVYYCDGSFIGSIRQIDGQSFDVTNGNTYKWNSTALALPTSDTANCIGEAGKNLLVGGVQNYVYPWDRISPTFNLPIILPEYNTTRIVVANNIAYVFAGSRGRIYRTNGTNIENYYSLPDFLSETNKPYFFWKDAIYHRNKIFFSFSLAENDGSAIATIGGVWSLSVETGAFVCENKLSYDTYAGFAGVLLPIFSGFTGTTPGALAGEGYYAIWSDGASPTTHYGVDAPSNDANSNATLYSNYEAYIDTDLIPVGQYLTKRTFENVEYKLARPLTTVEGVKIQYRTDISGTFVDLGETTTAGAISELFTMNFENVQWIQFRILLKAASTIAATSFVRLREVRLR